MKNIKEAPLYLKLYQLLKKFYSMVKVFPKCYKHSLGEDIIKLNWRCLDLFLEANLCPNNNKQEVISHLSVEFDKLKLRVRMSQELQIISIRQFSDIQNNYLIEIGKMIGAWLKWAGR